MSDAPKDSQRRKPLIRESTKKILMRALVRSIPLLPGPDLLDLVIDLRQSRTAIDEKITKAVSALRDASQLVAELEKSLKERTEKLNVLRQEVERYSKLAEVEEGKAKAIVQQLELSINKNKGVERLISLLLNLIAGVVVFVLGLILSPLITPYIKAWLGF